jgi:hypothetical protein
MIRAKKFARLGLVSFAVLLVIMPLISGDELPDNLLAHGRQERLLAGMDVLSATVAQAEEWLGKPTQEQVTDPEQKGIAGEKTYVWEKPLVKVTLKTGFLHDARVKGRYAESPEVITVEGSDGSIGRTGRGLKLGDKFSQVEKLYGHKFVRKGNTIDVQWKSGTDLLVTWNDDGLIDKIGLFAPE